MRKQFFPAAKLLAIVIMLTACGSTPEKHTGKPQTLPINTLESSSPGVPSNTLRVASLNIAHGRGESFNQLFVSSSAIRGNLDSIALFLAKNNIHIAALQEVDAPSSWSGNFDHARHIATEAGYRWWIQASHASMYIADYGTAVVSSMPLTAAQRLDFTPSPPTAGKGFTLAEVLWSMPDATEITVDVISLHMDFSRKSVRVKQIEELERALQERTNPLILMGDFNSEILAERLINSAKDNKRRLHTWPADSVPHYSYKKKRLDWIIVSGELEFVDYTTAEETLSDHRAIVASLRMREPT